MGMLRITIAETQSEQKWTVVIATGVYTRHVVQNIEKKSHR